MPDGSGMAGIRQQPLALLTLPFLIYAVSYLYLALYHSDVLLFSTVVHESGKLTFLQDMFYLSHFLGHVPVHVTHALVFVGSFLCLVPVSDSSQRSQSGRWWWAGTALFLAAAFLLSMLLFGADDTLAYLSQMKQRDDLYMEGGSWLLHLPSTMLLPLLMPAYVVAAGIYFKRPLATNRSGTGLISAGLLLAVLMTALFCEDGLAAAARVWTDPRYLAHSVREIATFPLTYFPLPLAFMLRSAGRKTADDNGTAGRIATVLLLLFLSGLLYQAAVPLRHGIGTLAQKPAFAGEAGLSIPYLLASHYFEHFTDTIFFFLLCMALFSWRIREKKPAAC